MSLVNLTMQNRTAVEVIEKLKLSEKPIVWAAANPALAAEMERWRDDPKRTKRFTADTVIEAIRHCMDEPLVQAVYNSDNRSGVESACLNALSRIRRFNDDNGVESRHPIRFHDEPLLVGDDIETLLSRSHRYHGEAYAALRKALANASDEQLVQLYPNYPGILIHEAVRRERWDLVASTQAPRSSSLAAYAAEVIGNSWRVEPAHARTAHLLKAYPPKLKMPWSPEAVEYARTTGDAVLLAFAGALEPGSVELSSISTSQAALVVTVTQDPKLVRWLWNKVMQSTDIDWTTLRDFCRNEEHFTLDERLALATKLPPGGLDGVSFDPADAPAFVRYALERSGEEWVLQALSSTGRVSHPTRWQYALANEILETVPGAVGSVLAKTYSAGFTLQIVVGRLADELTTTDAWSGFFSVIAGGFPGTLDDLVGIVGLFNEGSSLAAQD